MPSFLPSFFTTSRREANTTTTTHEDEIPVHTEVNDRVEDDGNVHEETRTWEDPQGRGRGRVWIKTWKRTGTGTEPTPNPRSSSDTSEREPQGTFGLRDLWEGLTGERLGSGTMNERFEQRTEGDGEGRDARLPHASGEGIGLRDLWEAMGNQGMRTPFPDTVMQDGDKDETTETILPRKRNLVVLDTMLRSAYRAGFNDALKLSPFMPMSSSSSPPPPPLPPLSALALGAEADDGDRTTTTPPFKFVPLTYRDLPSSSDIPMTTSTHTAPASMSSYSSTTPLLILTALVAGGAATISYRSLNRLKNVDRSLREILALTELRKDSAMLSKIGKDVTVLRERLEEVGLGSVGRRIEGLDMRKSAVAATSVRPSVPKVDGVQNKAAESTADTLNSDQTATSPVASTPPSTVSSSGDPARVQSQEVKKPDSPLPTDQAASATTASETQSTPVPALKLDAKPLVTEEPTEPTRWEVEEFLKKSNTYKSLPDELQALKTKLDGFEHEVNMGRINSDKRLNKVERSAREWKIELRSEAMDMIEDHLSSVKFDMGRLRERIEKLESVSALSNDKARKDEDARSESVGKAEAKPIKETTSSASIDPDVMPFEDIQSLVDDIKRGYLGDRQAVDVDSFETDVSSRSTSTQAKSTESSGSSSQPSSSTASPASYNSKQPDQSSSPAAKPTAPGPLSPEVVLGVNVYREWEFLPESPEFRPGYEIRMGYVRPVKERNERITLVRKRWDGLPRIGGCVKTPEGLQWTLQTRVRPTGNPAMLDVYLDGKWWTANAFMWNTRDGLWTGADQTIPEETPNTDLTSNTTPDATTATPRNSHPLTRALFQAIYYRGYTDASLLHHQDNLTLLEFARLHPIMTIIALSTTALLSAGTGTMALRPAAAGTRSLRGLTTSATRLAQTATTTHASGHGAGLAATAAAAQTSEEMFRLLGQIKNGQAELNLTVQNFEKKLMNEVVQLKDVLEASEKKRGAFNVGNVKEPVVKTTPGELDDFLAGKTVGENNSPEPVVQFDPTHDRTFVVEQIMPDLSERGTAKEDINGRPDGLVQASVMFEDPVHDAQGQFVDRGLCLEYEHVQLIYDNGAATSIKIGESVFLCDRLTKSNHRNQEEYVLREQVADFHNLDERLRAVGLLANNPDAGQPKPALQVVTPEEFFERHLANIRENRPDLFGPCTTIDPHGLEQMLIDNPDGLEFFLDERISGQGVDGWQEWTVRVRGGEVDGELHPFGKEIRQFKTNVFFAHFPITMTFGDINVDIMPSREGSWIVRNVDCED
nr:uncharacterized protein CI109_006533 [Kwoniella shandongensis]KAA5525163.1 hypothetical protein CI109_006533 [Kwoniella shandongensis]